MATTTRKRLEIAGLGAVLVLAAAFTGLPLVSETTSRLAGAALSAAPDPLPGQRSALVAGRWLDLGDVRAVVGEQHRGHRARYATGEVEHPDAVEYACHRDAPR